MLMRKACPIKQKRLETVKVLQLNILLKVCILMLCTYFIFFLMHLRSWDNSVFTLSIWCIGVYEKKYNLNRFKITKHEKIMNEYFHVALRAPYTGHCMFALYRTAQTLYLNVES